MRKKARLIASGGVENQPRLSWLIIVRFELRNALRAELEALGNKDLPLLALIALFATTGRFVADDFVLDDAFLDCKASDAGS